MKLNAQGAGAQSGEMSRWNVAGYLNSGLQAPDADGVDEEGEE